MVTPPIPTTPASEVHFDSDVSKEWLKLGKTITFIAPDPMQRNFLTFADSLELSGTWDEPLINEMGDIAGVPIKGKEEIADKARCSN